MIKLAKKPVNNCLAAAGLILVCWAQPSLAGYKSALAPSGVGQVSASLAYTTITNQAITPANSTRPSAGVTTFGTWTAKVAQPAGTPTVCTSTVSSVFLTGGYKAVARSYVTTGVTADDPDLSKKLADEQFVLIPGLCGAGYDIASGDEVIEGQRYLVVLGNATAGTAVWFRGYIYNGTLGTRDDIIQNGTKLYDVVVKGPFDFGDYNLDDRCKALKVPIDYGDDNIYLISDGIAVSTTDLAFVNPPTSLTIDCTDPQGYPTLQTQGGCGAVTVTFSPPFNTLPLGPSTVTATATDAAQNSATVQFQVTLPPIQFVNPPTSVTVSCAGGYPALQTQGGCGPVTVTFSPPFNTLPLGPSTVTATATDAEQNHTTYQFQVILPYVQFVNPPTSVTIGCTGPQAYPALQTQGGCGAVTVTFSPPFNTLPPGASTVTATATDAAQNHTAVQFQVIRPYIGFTGFDAPISGSGGDCHTPLRTINAPCNLAIKFNTTLCGSACVPTVTPTVTVTQINPTTCAVVAVPISNQYLVGVANQWHYNWNTTTANKNKRYRIDINLHDGNPVQLYAIIDLK